MRIIKTPDGIKKSINKLLLIASTRKVASPVLGDYESLKSRRETTPRQKVSIRATEPSPMIAQNAAPRLRRVIRVNNDPVFIIWLMAFLKATPPTPANGPVPSISDTFAVHFDNVTLIALIHHLIIRYTFPRIVDANRTIIKDGCLTRLCIFLSHYFSNFGSSKGR